jgi:hypothetical protein
MGLLSKRKNKKFSYEPRFYKGEGNPYEIKHKFDDYRKTVGENPNFKQKFVNAFDEFKNSPDKAANRRILIIFLVFILAFLIFIEFDLTIFFK